MTLCVLDDNAVCIVCGRPARHGRVRRECRQEEERGSKSKTPAPPAAEPMPSREAPGFLEKVRNFAVATAQHVAAGMPMASDEEIIRRHDICLTCEFLQDGACTQCGCPVSRVAGYVSKLSWADQECPVGKWGKATK